MKKIRVAFFGLAHPHAPILYKTISQASEEFEIIGFSEVPMPPRDPLSFEERVTKLSGKYGGTYYENWEELAALSPDLAIVNSDNGSRGEICCALLEKGINVLDEKPMAMSYEMAKRMRDAEQRHRVKMLTNWPIAWVPAFRMAKKLLDEGRIGKLLRVTYRSPATWGPYGDRPNASYADSWWFKAEYGGGSILDYACYGAMLSTWMFGKQAERVSCITKQFSTKFCNVEDYSAMMLDFGDGVGLLEGSWSTYNPGEVPTGPVLYGEKGVIVCDRYWSEVKIYTDDSHTPVAPNEVIDVGANNQRPEMLTEHVAQVIRGECEADEMISSFLNTAVVAALDAGIRSAKSGMAEKTEI